MMEHHFYEYVGKKTLAITALLSVIFFVCFTFILSGHVPDASPTWRMIWGAYAAMPLAGVFFFASMMLSVLMAERRQIKKARKAKA
ncbi:MAG: hypothetical protein Q7P63_08910 [Verrucomicrobiota bacterium JB022]|nr:hypothetical protein [Verrucomicrobiota bacterium JB022]